MIYFDIVFLRGHEVHLHLRSLDTRFDGCACFLTTDSVIVVISQTKTNNCSPDTNIKPSTWLGFGRRRWSWVFAAEGVAEQNLVAIGRLYSSPAQRRNSCTAKRSTEDAERHFGWRQRGYKWWSKTGSNCYSWWHGEDSDYALWPTLCSNATSAASFESLNNSIFRSNRPMDG